MRPLERTFPLRFGNLAARVWEGDSKKSQAPIFALHGWLDNASSFDRLIPLLETNRTVYAIDFAGHGLSDHRPPGAYYHFVDYIYEIYDFIESLGVPHVTLLGHSLGGAVAALFASLFPERMEKLVLLESLGPLASLSEEDFIEKLRESFLARHSLPSKKPPVYPSVEKAAMARMVATAISSEGARILAQRGTCDVEGGVTWRSDRRLTLPPLIRFTEAQARAILEKIQCPTLVILAEEGIFNTYPQFDTRLNLIRNIAVVRVPGHHHVHLDTPETVAPAIVQFLNS